MRVAALGLCLALVGTAHAQTPVSEVLSAALVAPFDQQDGHKTYLTAHGGGALHRRSPACPAVDHALDVLVRHLRAPGELQRLLDAGRLGGDRRLATWARSAPTTSASTRGFDLDRLPRPGDRPRVPDRRQMPTPRRPGLPAHRPGDLGHLVDRRTTRTNAAAGDRMQSLNLGDDGAVAVPGRALPRPRRRVLQPGVADLERGGVSRGGRAVRGLRGRARAAAGPGDRGHAGPGLRRAGAVPVACPTCRSRAPCSRR